MSGQFTVEKEGSIKNKKNPASIVKDLSSENLGDM